MFCPNCGAENANGTKFCASCGAGLEAPASETPAVTPEQNAAPKKDIGVAVKSALNDLLQIVKPLGEKVKPIVQKNKLLLTAIGGALILLVCICTIVGILTAGNGYTDYEHFISATVQDDVVCVIYDNKVIKTDIEADGIDNSSTSIDGKIMAFLTDEGELAVVKGKKVTVVAEDVEGFMLSVDGKGIVYLTEDDEESCLYLYNVSSKKDKLITDDADDLSSLAIAPNGKSVAYGIYDEEDEKTRVMYFKGSDSIRVASGELSVVGMSNNGKQIYIVSRDEKEDEDGDTTYSNVLNCYNTKGDKEKLCEKPSSVRFNEDHTQVLFTSEGKSYISTKGKEPVKISNSSVTPLVASNASTFSDSNAVTYPISNLFNRVYVGYDSNDNYSAWYIRKNTDKSCKLVSGVGRVKLDASAEYLYYVDDEELKVLKISHGENASDKAKLIAEDVGNYVVTSDRSKVYYVSDGGLYCVNGKKGGSKKTIASDDVSSTLAINKKDVVFYIMDGDAFASSGSKGKRAASEINSLISTPNGLVYATNSDAIFVSTGSKKLSKIWESD